MKRSAMSIKSNIADDLVDKHIRKRYNFIIKQKDHLGRIR